MGQIRVGPRGAALVAGAFAETFAHWGIVLCRREPWNAVNPSRAQKEHRDHNTRVAEELKQLGLFPVGDINTYLRTEGSPENG